MTREEIHEALLECKKEVRFLAILGVVPTTRNFVPLSPHLRAKYPQISNDSKLFIPLDTSSMSIPQILASCERTIEVNQEESITIKHFVNEEGEKQYLKAGKAMLQAAALSPTELLTDRDKIRFIVSQWPDVF